MMGLWGKSKSKFGNQKGITNLIVLLIILPSFLAVVLMVVIYSTFQMRQAKIDDVKMRALQMVQTKGYLSQVIIDDTRTKLSRLGVPTVTKGGITYPLFTGSTMTKVFRDDADPTVKLVIQYPASDLSRVMAFFGVTSFEDPGYYHLQADGRSEAYE